MAPARVAIVPDAVTADVVCGLLRQNGIECFHRRTDVAAGAADGGFGSAGPTEVLVDERDLDAARRVLPAES
jgi:Putative prokaryotic signal transducing protein